MRETEHIYVGAGLLGMPGDLAGNDIFGRHTLPAVITITNLCAGIVVSPAIKVTSGYTYR